MKNVPLGVYNHPADSSLAPTVMSVPWPEDIGPFRVKEYGEGFYAFTRARDWISGKLDSVMP